MKILLGRGVEESEGELILLFDRLKPRNGAFFFDHDRLLCLDELELRLAETLGGRPKVVPDAVKHPPRPPGAAAGESTALPRLHAAPFLD